MRDRFDQRAERELDTTPNSNVAVAQAPGVATAVAAGPGRRREWPAAEKARIIVESLTPGANVSAVARRNGLSPQQLFGWRREARELFADDRGETRAAGNGPLSPSATCGLATSGARNTAPASLLPAFVPILVASESRRTAPSSGEDAAVPRADPIENGVIEIVIGRNIVRVSGRVDAETLQSVIEIVRRLACS